MLKGVYLLEITPFSMPLIDLLNQMSLRQKDFSAKKNRDSRVIVM